MKLILKKNYKALTPFETDDLPRLVVLTGKNGSGKSQLLELLSKKDPNLPADQQQLATELTIQGRVIRSVKLTKFGQVSQFPRDSGNKAVLDNLVQTLIKQLPRAKLGGARKQYTKLFERIAKLNGVSLEKLEARHINEHEFSTADFELKDIFNANITQIVVSYFEAFWRNVTRRTANAEFGQTYDTLTLEQFDSKHVNPFDRINTILEAARVDYRLRRVEAKEYHALGRYSPEFVDTRTKSVIDPNDFSSGELVLLSLAFTVLNTTTYENESLPNLLLLDELDAPLHPSMIRNLLDVVALLIDSTDMDVFLTTHNPTTVALSPPESVYVLRKLHECTDNNRLVKSDKRAAIRELLDGVRALDIIPENRRQVFVESRTDEHFFESVSACLKLSADVHVNFIASGVHDGDCELVRATVRKLREAGNDRVFGIIDWDSTNRSVDPWLIVNGESEFYSIENIILNPIHLGLLLIDQRIVGFLDVSLVEGQHWIERRASFSSAELESIAAFVQSRVLRSLGIDEEREHLVNVKLHDGKQVQMNSTYLQLNGHSLVQSVRQTFPQLNKYQDRVLLSEAVSRIIAHSVGFLPKSCIRSIETVFQA